MKKTDYPIPNAEISKKLVESRRNTKGMERRTIYCPVCGFRLMDAYGHEHVVSVVKCQKCKFCEPLDLRLFRTVRSLHF